MSWTIVIRVTTSTERSKAGNFERLTCGCNCWCFETVAVGRVGLEVAADFGSLDLWAMR